MHFPFSRLALVVLSFAGWSGKLFAADEVVVVPATRPPVVFSGKPAKIELRLGSRTGATVHGAVTYRVWQLTSATAAPVAAAQPWKEITLAAEQTVIETIETTLPATRAATLFRIEVFFAERPIGRQTVIACPENLFAGAEVVIHDPADRLKTALREQGATIREYTPEPFPLGLPVIFGPYEKKEDLPPDCEATWQRIAAGGNGVVVLLPATEIARLSPSGLFKVQPPLPSRDRKIIPADASRFTDFAHSAAAQFELQQLIQQAISHRPLPPLHETSP